MAERDTQKEQGAHGPSDIDALFKVPSDPDDHADSEYAAALTAEMLRLSPPRSADPRIFEPLDKDGVLWQLDASLKDLARQETTEYRGRYYGECTAILKTLRMIGWIDSAEDGQWYADILAAHQLAIGRCQAAGLAVEQSVIDQEAYRLRTLAASGITPRSPLGRSEG